MVCEGEHFSSDEEKKEVEKQEIKREVDIGSSKEKRRLKGLLKGAENEAEGIMKGAEEGWNRRN